MPNEYWRTGRFLEQDYELEATVLGYQHGGFNKEPTWEEFNYRASTRSYPPYGEEEFYGEPRWMATQLGMVPGPYVGRGPRYRRSDERIAEEVCERLTRHGRVDASEIEVEVSGGEVTLSGTVRSRPMKRMATDVAESVTGAVDVHNRLRIR